MRIYQKEDCQQNINKIVHVYQELYKRENAEAINVNTEIQELIQIISKINTFQKSYRHFTCYQSLIYKYTLKKK